MRRRVIQLYIKNNEVIFSLAWNIIFTDNYKVLVLNFLEMKNMVFLSQKVDGNMIFTDYWKILVLIFSRMGNTVFSWAKKLMEMRFTDYWKGLVLDFPVMGNTVFFRVKKLMERWYLLVTEKFLFWTFWWLEIRSFFSQNVDGKMIFTWSSWAFYNIPGHGKYGFLHSVKIFPFEIIVKLFPQLQLIRLLQFYQFWFSWVVCKCPEIGKNRKKNSVAGDCHSNNFQGLAIF